MLIVPLRAAALFAIVSALSAAPAQAMPGNAAPSFTDPAERFAVMDTDKDGRISWKEFSTARPNLNENAFKSIDADSDGSISLDEWKAFSSGHDGMAKTPDMSSMMKAMGGKGMAPAIGPNAIPSDDDSAAMPLVMPPQGHSHPAPAGSSMPLITPPSAPAKADAASGSMPLIMPPKAGK
ncbi:EF-hand domain-containing protein [Mailhella sp.]|uniref:EF-hand domain-containing protein n=1 Tax=Mailhella sp. TaxID=1981029 RepID=UPI0040634B05